MNAAQVVAVFLLERRERNRGSPIARDRRGYGAIERCVAGPVAPFDSADRHGRHARLGDAEAARVLGDVLGRETAAELEESDSSSTRVDGGEGILTLERGNCGVSVAPRSDEHACDAPECFRDRGRVP